MKKIGVKKLLLYISALPYAYCIVMSLYHAIFGYSYDSEFISDDYGIDAIGNFLSNYWVDNIINLNIVTSINIFAIIYPIYYFITTKKVTQKKKDSDKRKVNINVRKILFVLSSMCWALYFLSGIYAFFFGCNVGGFMDYEIGYGMEALKETLFWNFLAFSIIPVLPISLIYIIIYLIARYREKRKKNKMVVNE